MAAWELGIFRLESWELDKLMLTGNSMALASR